jgi:2-polyprenyl-6-methoxyphenol hydroxylase-like FAD-dependent oxidoreductase
MAPETISVGCCVAGGGPAGMMLGYLLARAGVQVLVLEKHADFLRDFRGDTIHPSTLEVMHELGLLDEFLELPHQKVYELNAQVGEMRLTIADFRHLPTRCGFVAFMPQWDFLNFLAKKGTQYPNFDLMMEAEVTGLIEESGRVVGVRAKTPSGEIEVRADLVVGADGRSSIVREKAGLQVKEFGAPMDVLWFRLKRTAEDPAATMGRFATGRIFIALNRGDYWQCGYVIAKGQFEEMRRQPFETFRAAIVKLAPYVSDSVQELRGWDEVKLLTVRVDRLLEWFRPGLLCIGDAAHAPDPEAPRVAHADDAMVAGRRTAADHRAGVGRDRTAQAAARGALTCQDSIPPAHPGSYRRPRHPPGTYRPGANASMRIEALVVITATAATRGTTANFCVISTLVMTP